MGLDHPVSTLLLQMGTEPLVPSRSSCPGPLMLQFRALPSPHPLETITKTYVLPFLPLLPAPQVIQPLTGALLPTLYPGPATFSTGISTQRYGQAPCLRSHGPWESRLSVTSSVAPALSQDILLEGKEASFTCRMEHLAEQMCLHTC